MREILKEFYRDWLNDFLTIGRCAEYYHLTEKQAKTLIDIGKELHDADIPHEKAVYKRRLKEATK